MAGIAGGTMPAPSHAHAPRPAAAPVVEHYEDDEDYEEDLLDDEPKRGRKLMVVGALVGAICVGGGLAYAYKAFSSGKTPLIAGKQQPLSAKAAPQQVAAKLPDAVPAAAPIQAVAPGGAVDDGPRRVQTIAVVPPGGQPVAPPQPAPPPTANVMPGMVLDNLPRPAAVQPPVPQQQAAVPTAPLRPSAPAAAPAPPPVQPTVQLPVKAAPPVQPKVANTPPPAAPEAKPEPARKVAQAPVPKAKTSDAYNPNTAPGVSGGVATVATAAPAGKAALGAGGSNGYVATVLSTQRGRPEAMKAFADLQQKYPDVLGTKPAEVQEKDLGTEKGIWYRAVVGPPGSRAAAAEVCTQLKASGYGQCFVSAY